MSLLAADVWTSLTWSGRSRFLPSSSAIWKVHGWNPPIIVFFLVWGQMVSNSWPEIAMYPIPLCILLLAELATWCSLVNLNSLSGNCWHSKVFTMPVLNGLPERMFAIYTLVEEWLGKSPMPLVLWTLSWGHPISKHSSHPSPPFLWALPPLCNLYACAHTDESTHKCTTDERFMRGLELVNCSDQRKRNRLRPNDKSTGAMGSENSLLALKEQETGWRGGFLCRQ